MKSLMRIYIRSLITCFLLFAAFILVQMGIAAVVAGRIYNREVPGRYFIQNIYEALGTGGEEALLDEMGASFAMLLDDEGNLVWSKDLPGELAHSYTSFCKAPLTVQIFLQSSYRSPFKICSLNCCELYVYIRTIKLYHFIHFMSISYQQIMPFILY